MSESIAAQFRGVVESREGQIRESWVKAMELRITRDVLNQCQKIEGVNNFENCRELADRYTKLLADSKVKGYRKIDVA